jgi:hypothetical protein
MSEKKGIDPEVITQLRSRALTNRPSDVLRLLIRLVPGLGSFQVISYFSMAFPQVPLRTCIEAQAPAQLYEGGITDDQFDALFTPWLKGQSIGKE